MLLISLGVSCRVASSGACQARNSRYDETPIIAALRAWGQTSRKRFRRIKSQESNACGSRQTKWRRRVGGITARQTRSTSKRHQITMARRNHLNAILAIALALASYGLLKNAAHRAAASANPNAHSEISRLAEEMQWKPGMTIADIGAGDGSYSFAAEKIVGASGHVYATEIDAAKLATLRDEVAKQKLANVTIVESAADDTKLPTDCCDAIFLRRVYHHITAPEAFDKNLLRSLKPGAAPRHHRLRAGQQPAAGRRRPRQSRRPRHPAKNHGRRINRGRLSRRENNQSLVGQRLLRNLHEARRITRDGDDYGCGSGCARPSAITFSTSSALRGSFSVISLCPSAVTSTSSSIRTPRFSSRI